MRKQSGFTLIEMVMVLVLLSIIAVMASKMMATGFQAYFAGKNITNVDWQGRIALERMAHDIRATRSPTDITTATASQLTFTDINNASVSYSLSSNRILRNTQTLADNIQSLTFSYYDENGVVTAVLTNIRYIKISLTVGSTDVNYALTTSIFPRDLP